MHEFGYPVFTWDESLGNAPRNSSYVPESLLDSRIKLQLVKIKKIVKELRYKNTTVFCLGWYVLLSRSIITGNQKVWRMWFAREASDRKVAGFMPVLGVYDVVPMGKVLYANFPGSLVSGELF